MFVCAAVRVCVLSVGVGYWINENSIKWSDCSVMWSQTQEIWWGVIRLLLESKGCCFSLMHIWAYSLCSKSIREWSDMLLSRTSGQTCVCDRRLDILFLFLPCVWLTLTNTNYQLHWCVIIGSKRNTSLMKTRVFEICLSAKIYTASLVNGGKKASVHNNLILADLRRSAFFVSACFLDFFFLDLLLCSFFYM